jgi:hypothetical protein
VSPDGAAPAATGMRGDCGVSCGRSLPCGNCSGMACGPSVCIPGTS